jgi:hypothetical protein
MLARSWDQCNCSGFVNRLDAGQRHPPSEGPGCSCSARCITLSSAPATPGSCDSSSGGSQLKESRLRLLRAQLSLRLGPLSRASQIWTQLRWMWSQGSCARGPGGGCSSCRSCSAGACWA